MELVTICLALVKTYSSIYSWVKKPERFEPLFKHRSWGQIEILVTDRSETSLISQKKALPKKGLKCFILLVHRYHGF
jgi:hypothetical protein